MKTALLQTNFTGGEIAPSLGGRVDVAKYGNAVARMENWHPRVQGGARTRPGLRYLGAARGDGRLIPFVYSRTLGYQLEFTAFRLRIWRADGVQIMAGSTPLELVTPYSLADLGSLNWEQAEDTAFLFHTARVPHRLQRLADDAWRLEPAPFVVAPFAEQGLRAATAATLSAVTVGAGRTITAAAPIFLAGDVGRDVVSGFGAGTITAVASATSATLDVSTAFASTALAADAWLLDGSPQAFIRPAAKDPVGATIALAAALPRQAAVTIADTGSGGRTITSTVSVFTAADVGRRFYADAGVLLITAQAGFTADGTLESEADFLSASYPAGGWGITGGAFRAQDVGSYIRAASTGALYRIAAVPSAAEATVEIRTAASALVAVPPGAWSLERTVWSDAAGYPGAGTLDEQRLWLAGVPTKPQAIFASRIGEYLNFEAGLLDDSAFSYALSMRQRNLIRHLVGGRRLFAFGEGAEVALRGGNEKAIGPTNIQKDDGSAYGTGAVRPVVIGKEILFVQGAGRKVRALGYSAAADGFDSPDRTVFAEHVTASGIVEMAYAAEPDSLLYAVRADGQMAVCAYSVEQEVIGWSRYVTDGAFRSVSVVPAVGADAVWTLVRRTVGGVDRFFVEVFDEAVCTDCATVLHSSSATWGALGHLEGRQVVAKADGVHQGAFTVEGGQITLPRIAHDFEAGLAFVPELELLPPEVGGATGTRQGSNLSVHEVVVRVLDTDTLDINGEQTDFRRFGEPLLDRPPPGYDGDYRAITLTDSVFKPKLLIRQPFPYRAHVLAVVRKVTVNDT